MGKIKTRYNTINIQQTHKLRLNDFPTQRVHLHEKCIPGKAFEI